MNPLQRAFSKIENKPFRRHDLEDNEPPYLNEDGYVDFRPGDKEDPHNWSMRRRVVITISAVLLVMNATFASSAPSGCLGSISESFNVSSEAAGLTITVFLMGYVAGPLVFAPASEEYGRRWVFYITFAIYIIFNFLCAFAPNFGSLLVGRFITGTAVSAPLSNAPGVLADLWDPLSRGNAMAGFSAMVWIGPALGPVVAGFLELKKDWRWVFYVLLWLGGITMVLALTIPETYAPRLLVLKARRIRKARIPGYENVQAPVEAQGRTLVDLYKVALTRPWVILFDTISFLVAIYMSVVYCLLYMLFSIYPIVFQERRGWNSGVGELPLIGSVCGAIIGAGFVIMDTRRQQKKRAEGKELEPEDRLPMTMVGGIGFAITMFWFAWTAEYNSIHWFVPTLAGAFLAASLLLVFVGYLNYLVDTYKQYAASAIAANTVARSACGAAAPLFTHQMFSALGIGGGGSLIGGVATVLAVIPFLFYKYGKRIRIKSKFAPTKPEDEGRQKDEEHDDPTSYTVQGPRRPEDAHVASGEAEKDSSEETPHSS